MALSMRPARALLLAALCVALPARHAESQRVSGRVFVSDSSHGVAGVVVQLGDSSGAVVARALSRADGRFALAAPRPGSFTIRTLRLGFRPSTYGPFVVGPAGRDDVSIALQDLPVTLAAVRVTDRNQCLLASGQAGVDVLTVWEEAQKSLLASLVARGEAGFDVTTTVYERVLSATTHRVVRQMVRQRRGASARPFVSAISPDDYLTLGYRDVDREGTTFRAPDADVLLSEAFAAHHCLRLAEDARDDEIGVRFEPVDGRPARRADGSAFIDVAGTLWLARRTARLLRAEFGYTGLESELATTQSSGRLDFTYLPGDVPVISAWNISIPRLEATRRASGPPLRVVDHWVTGGELAEARRGGAAIWHAPDASLRGAVREGDRGPSRGATVRLAGTTYAARTDDTGAFAIDHILPGPYEVLVRSALSERLALNERPGGSIDARADERMTLALDAGTSDEAVRTRCGRGSATHGAVIGEVRDLATAGERPWIAALWQDATTLTAGDLSFVADGAQTRADSLGRFWLCDVGKDRGLRLIVARDSAMTARLASVSTRIHPDSLFVNVGITKANQAPPRVRVRGRVVTASATPVSNALVDLVGASSVRTDSLGRFSLDAEAGASYLLRARRIGYQLAMLPLADVTDRSPEIVVTLQRPATMLAGVVVEADSTSFDETGFEARRATGKGTYLTRKDVELRGALRAEYLVGSIPGLKVDPDGRARMIHARERVVLDACWEGMQILIDGVPAAGPEALRFLDVGFIRAVEVYRDTATTPPELRTPRSQCGTVAIWMK